MAVDFLTLLSCASHHLFFLQLTIFMSPQAQKFMATLPLAGVCYGHGSNYECSLQAARRGTLLLGTAYAQLPTTMQV